MNGIIVHTRITHFFYPSQRDTLGKVIIESNVVDALPVNMSKWRECAKMLGDQTFKDTGKLEYGYEIGHMAVSDGYTCGGKKSWERMALPLLSTSTVV